MGITGMIEWNRLGLPNIKINKSILNVPNEASKFRNQLRLLPYIKYLIYYENTCFISENIIRKVLGIQWRLSRILKTRKKSVCFLTCKSSYILKVYSVQYTSKWNTNVKKIHSDKINVTNNALFFSFANPNSSVLLLIRHS